MKPSFSLLLAAALLGQHAGAQRTLDVAKASDQAIGTSLFFAGGQAFVDTKYVSLKEGSPYLFDEFKKAIMVGKDGAEYKAVPIKLNLVDGEVLYKDERGNEMISTIALKEIVVQDGDRQLDFIHSSIIPSPTVRRGWYQELVFDTVSLYKLYDKRIEEVKPYNSATVEQRIVTVEKYYVLVNRSFLEIKKPKDLPALLPSHQAEMEAFLKGGEIASLPVQERLQRAIAHYASLLKKR
jgi:hypothetical protein